MSDPASFGRRLRWRQGALLVALAATAALAVHQRAAVRGSVDQAINSVKELLRRRERPHVEWATARPEDEGLSGELLEDLGDSLSAAATAAFLVVRGNRVVYERYGRGSGPNVPFGMSAMAKAVTGTVAVLAAVSDGHLALDDLASQYIPRWRSDSLRGTIRIRDLVAHRAGMDDVDFGLGAAKQLDGWKQRYFDHREERFGFALDTVAMLFPPGSRIGYSGVSYYALAYALTSSLRKAPQRDIKTLLRERVFRPLGIPDDNWRVNYGQTHEIDGMTLYAIGSGADYSARAAARIGELFLDHGRAGDRQVLDSGLVGRALEPGSESPPEGQSLPDAPPMAGGGWWLNVWGSWPGVPRDAYAGLGAGHQVILVVPSLDLIAVRMGKDLSEDPAQFDNALRDRVFGPLMRAVIGPSSRMAQRP